ncbi:alanine racemase [Agrobacterium vitis]|uniref:alanine racemase n=1 Tax=Agrobacterium vitis TaxID=373 RepID=UPI0012E90E9E|nr:alanine racemase [Agrobacterium vitis]MVA37532.1 D-TA family PLP-dependent enzyme [Agrobacterium vitis]
MSDSVTFPWPSIGTPIDLVATPIPIIDEDRVAANIARVQTYMNQCDKSLRVHIKTHKLPAIARQQLSAGAVGINCQKLTEAEVFADAGFEDILLSYNIVGPKKLTRLQALNSRVAKLKVVADSGTVVEALAIKFRPDRPLAVLVECDTGGGRCGVKTPGAVVSLAESIKTHASLEFAGILTYPAIGSAGTVERFFAESMALLADRGISCPIRSNGGSPDLFNSDIVPSANEHRAGTYVYNDRSMVRVGHCRAEDVAIAMLATVVSRPSPGRAILDCGSKSLTSDLIGFDNYGLVEGFDDARIVALYEEHAVVEFGRSFAEVGSAVKVIPNHACPISNLFDRVVFHRNGLVTRVEMVAARGMVW